MLHRPVADKALKLADGHGIAFATEHAFAFALTLLRADAATHRRQRGVLPKQSGGFLELPFLDERDKIGNADMHGTALHALRPLTVEATASLLHSLLGIIAIADLAEIVATHLGCLLAHGHPRLGRQLLMRDAADMTLVILT